MSPTGPRETKRAEQQGGTPKKERRILNATEQRENKAMPVHRLEIRSTWKLPCFLWLTDFSVLCLSFPIFKESLETVPNSVTLFCK